MNPFHRSALLFLASFFLAIPVPAQPGKAVAGLRTVVIDPGHGGTDAGCVSADRKTYEKNITLDISRRLAEKISARYPEVKVKMTRSDDRFIKLQDRGKIANDAGGDLFISVHVNATDKGASANGYSVHCLGKSSNKNRDIFNENLTLVKRENAVVKLEDDYKTTYQGFDPDDPESSIIFTLIQNAHLSNSLGFAGHVLDAMASGPVRNSRGVSQDPFLVLARAACPAVLVEVGFITNPQDLAVMRTEKGRDGIAENIFKAFCRYKTAIDASVQPDVAAPSVEEEKTAEAAAPEAAADEAVFYGVQILASSKRMDSADPFFQGYVPTVVKAGKLYKYIVATSSSLKEVKNKFAAVQKKYPDAYLVKVEDGVCHPVR